MTPQKKARADIPKGLAAECQYSSDRTCCVCNEPGKPIQIHHIDENPANNVIENLAVLCLHCHEQTQISGGFGRKLDSHQVIKFRQSWLDRVSYRRGQADYLAIQCLNGRNSTLQTENSSLSPPIPLADYIALLPSLLERAYENAQKGWSGTTADMMTSCYETISAIEGILTYLTGFYPKEHFDGRLPRDYISEVISSRFSWHRHIAEPGGDGTGGTIIGPTVAAKVISDMERMVENMVLALSGEFNENFDKFIDWKAKWDHASICSSAGLFRRADSRPEGCKTNPYYEKPSYWIDTADGKDGPFCQRCYDTDSKLIRLQGGNNDIWFCHECKGKFYGSKYQPPTRKIISSGWKTRI